MTLTKYVIYQFNRDINIQFSAYSNYYLQEQNKLKNESMSKSYYRNESIQKIINIIIYENDIIII